MKRDLAALTAREHDLLVVGGGISGVAAAWDAAQRGLATALIEAEDFGGDTSWNSLKTIHGGLRHLQRGSLGALRESVRERRALLRIAPDVVRPLAFLVPAYGHGWRGREALAAGLLANDLLSWDRNRGLAAESRIGAGRLLSRKEALARLPGLDRHGLTGAAEWTDAQVTHSERLVMGFARAAADAGASVANRIAADRLLVTRGRAHGVAARDGETGASLEIRARVVLNAAGPQLGALLASGGLVRPAVPQLRAWNFVLSRPVVTERAVGAGAGDRLLFLVPWLGQSIVGTGYAPESADRASLVGPFLGQVQAAFPWAGIAEDDVGLIHWGRVPGTDATRGLLARSRLIDHRREDGVDGLLSLLPAKYTTARGLAEAAVDRVCARLGRAAPPCRTAATPLPAARRLSGDLEGQTRAAVRDEMARSLADVVLRRTGLGAAGPPPAAALSTVLATLAAELDWGAQRIRAEREALARDYGARTLVT